MPARAHEVVDGTFDAPTFTVAMARKDLELVLQEAQRHESDLCIVPGVAKMFDEGIARGDGSRDVNAAARLA
jgi:3-hydroxyisobutyrate dehydrogenase-like beta-hydroxyacid dehydrogenase